VEPGARIELATYALRESSGACRLVSNSAIYLRLFNSLVFAGAAL